MEDQEPDGAERRVGLFIAVALLLLAVPGLAGVGVVGAGAAMFYRLVESPAVSPPTDIPVSPVSLMAPTAPLALAQPVPPHP